MNTSQTNTTPATTSSPEIAVPDNIAAIAAMIRKDWKKVNYAAEPYLQGMFALNTLEDKVLHDDARSVINYFLGNAGSWRGPVAKAVKAKLNKMIAS